MNRNTVKMPLYCFGKKEIPLDPKWRQTCNMLQDVWTGSSQQGGGHCHSSIYLKALPWLEQDNITKFKTLSVSWQSLFSDRCKHVQPLPGKKEKGIAKIYNILLYGPIKNWRECIKFFCITIPFLWCIAVGNIKVSILKKIKISQEKISC